VSADLFRVETDRVLLVWAATRDAEPAFLSPSPPPPGRLVVRARRPDTVFGAQTWRAGVPGDAAHSADTVEGPRLWEETGYSLYLRAKDGRAVAIEHRDPAILGTPAGFIITATGPFAREVIAIELGPKGEVVKPERKLLSSYGFVATGASEGSSGVRIFGFDGKTLTERPLCP